MKRLLYISPGPVPPSLDKSLSKFSKLSEIISGDIIQPVWWNSDQIGIEKLGAENYPNFKVDNFCYRLFALDKYPKFFRRFIRIFLYIKIAKNLINKNGRYDYIMCYGTNSTGISACLIKIFFGGKLIVEIPGVPEDGSLFDKKDNTLIDYVDHFLKILSLYIVGMHADIFKLLYDTQVSNYPILRNKLKSVFHDFVPTEKIKAENKSDQNYTILLGYPWYRKGADLLIIAFNKILKEFPELDFKIKIVGWIKDKEYLLSLSNNDPRIEILPPVSQDQAFKLISNSSFLSIPSRSEAMGRVVLEAMAASKAVLGSNVNGIPTYLKNHVSGIIFKTEDISDLSLNLKKLIFDKNLRDKLGEGGFQIINKDFSEQAYVSKFQSMLSKLDKDNNV